MLRGLQGRSVAVLTDGSSAHADGPVIAALERAGAVIHRLDCPTDHDLPGGRYAALVLTGDGEAAERAAADDRLVQLVREFLASDKPVAALGDAQRVIAAAGGAAGRRLSAPANAGLRGSLEGAGATLVDEAVVVDESLVTSGEGGRSQDFAERLVLEFADRLEEHEVDDMSDLSFPASDPPASSPSTITRGRADDADSRA